MALVINSNINSLKGMSSLRQSSNRLSKTLEHISSGIRVNKAADDAGRLGSITLAESQVRGLKKSIQNQTSKRLDFLVFRKVAIQALPGHPES